MSFTAPLAIYLQDQSSCDGNGNEEDKKYNELLECCRHGVGVVP